MNQSQLLQPATDFSPSAFWCSPNQYSVIVFCGCSIWNQPAA